MNARIMLAAATIFAAAPAPAAEIWVAGPRTTYDVTTVYLRGTIWDLDDVTFKHLTEAIKGPVEVELESRGGSCGAAIRIGSFIHMNHWTTVVHYGEPCNSACALIWLSGVYRSLDEDARIGVHSTALSDGSGKRNEPGNVIVANYLRSISIPERIIQRWHDTEPSNIDYIYYPEMLAFGLISEPAKSNVWKKGDRGHPMFKLIPPAKGTPPATKIDSSKN